MLGPHKIITLWDLSSPFQTYRTKFHEPDMKPDIDLTFVGSLSLSTHSMTSIVALDAASCFRTVRELPTKTQHGL